MKYTTITKLVVEQAARIAGEQSAATIALKLAEALRNPVFLKRNDNIVVFDATTVAPSIDLVDDIR